MSHELGPSQYEHAVVVRLLSPPYTLPDGTVVTELPAPNTGNPAHVTIPLNTALENVREVWLDEYHITVSDPPPANFRNLWFLSLNGTSLLEHPTTNAQGFGFPLTVSTVPSTHIYYANPKVISCSGKQGIRTLDVRVTQEFGVAPTFLSMTFYLRFVMDNPKWSVTSAMQRDETQSALQPNRPNYLVGRFRP